MDINHFEYINLSIKFICASLNFIQWFIYLIEIINEIHPCKNDIHPCKWIKITINFKFSKLQAQASRSCTSHPPTCNNIIFVNDIYLFHGIHQWTIVLMGNLILHQLTNFSLSSLIYPNCQLPTIVSKTCQYSNYVRKIIWFQFGTHESPKYVKPQNKHLETMFCGTSTKSKVVQNFMASHTNGKTSPIHSSTTCAQWLHLMSLPQRWNHQLVLLGFRKWQATANNGSRVLLTYSTTICITFAHPTDALTTSKDLEHGSNINANMLWALLAL